MNVSTKKPAECSRHELDEFKTLALQGGEVAAGKLPDRIRKASLLLFLRLTDGSLKGISALKQPMPTYRAKVFHHAQSHLRPDDFGLELGWIFVDESERGKKLSHVLVEQLLPFAGKERIYATTREDNPRMISTLNRFRFRREGGAYPSERGPYNLLLFIR